MAELTGKFKGYIKSALRRVNRWWPAYTAAKAKARVERGKYECAGCKEICPSKDIHVDHIAPVVDPARGFTTWDEYIDRLFCDMDGLQILCKTCHKKKTKEESAIRKEARRAKKETGTKVPTK